jgi:hypothetical protein
MPAKMGLMVPAGLSAWMESETGGAGVWPAAGITIPIPARAVKERREREEATRDFMEREEELEGF